MTPDQPRTTKAVAEPPAHQVGGELIRDIVIAEYGSTSPLLDRLLIDLVDIYHGRWERCQACQVGYHNLDHAFDVALATARMMAGWNKLADNPPITEELFLTGVAAGFFHDSGFLKDRGDDHGRGGKFTFSHVQRSMDLAAWYLAKASWPERLITLVLQMIEQTEFHEQNHAGACCNDPIADAIGRMVATADLVAQMADVDYMVRIHQLFEEFQEAYDFEGREALAARGIHIFGSAQEMIDNTMGFYEHYVLPRLRKLGRMDQYLVVFFGEGRNPYLENIAANLTAHMTDRQAQRRRLGEILQDLGVVTAAQIEAALGRQQAGPATQPRLSPESLSRRLLSWMDRQFTGKGLGDILVEMGAVQPTDLRRGLLSQTLPPAVTEQLTRRELLVLLEIGVLLQNVHRDPWLLGQVMEMTTELLGCETGSIMLANPEHQELVVVLPSGLQKDLIRGQTVPIDKGLGGWVFRHGRPAVAASAQLDDRWNHDLDRRVGFETKSVLAVPFHIHGERLGVIEVFNKKNDIFTEHDIDILTMLADMVAAALELVVRLEDGHHPCPKPN